MARREAYWGYLFVAPPLLGFLIFGFVPIIMSLVLAFTRWDMFRPPKFAGLSNFERIGSDPIVLQSVANTLVLFLGVPIGIALSLWLAMALNRKIRGVNFYRAIYYLPAVSSIVAISLLWQWIFNPEKGLLNMYLLNFGIVGPEWLQNPAWVKPALILMGVWGGMGPNMILYLAGLQGVPQSLYEAAAIDGARPWQQFLFVTWPMLTPTTFFITVMSVIGALQYFGQIYIMTQGRPGNSTNTLIYYIYQQGITSWNIGYGSALSTILFAALLLFTVIYLSFGEKRVSYER